MSPLRLLSASTLALALAMPALATPPSLRDFQLPPAPTPTPTQSPRVQGPVDTDGIVPVAPRVIPTASLSPATSPSPSPRAQTTASPVPTASPQSTPAQTRRATPPDAGNETAPSPSRAARPEPTIATATPPQTSQPSDSLDQDAVLPDAETVVGSDVSPSLPREATALPQIAGSTGSNGIPLWPWLLVLLAATAAGAFWYRQRSSGTAAFAGVPTIEPPLARRPSAPTAPDAAPEPAPSAAAAPAAPSSQGPAIALRVAPASLTRSMRFVTFSFRVTLRNEGRTPLRNIAVGADLTSAHAGLPPEQQLASPDTELPPVGSVELLEPGEVAEIAKDVRLDLSAVRVIRQGNAPLYVPLMRVRLSAEGQEPMAKTVLIGTLPEDRAKRLQPFRLDEMPQTYRDIGTLALD